MLHFHTTPLVSVLLTCAIMAALIAFVYLLKIPNPNMILITGLVITSAVFGYPGGVTAGVFMLGYTLFFFSTDNDFVTFTPENMQKVFVSLFGIVADLLFVCSLKKREQRAYRKMREINTLLQIDNHLLEQASLSDPLTGLGNRLALRRDYPLFLDHDVFTLMLDLDNFKTINDTYGHSAGDLCLRETGRLLQSLFQDRAYRFGGDEFLVICPDQSKEVFHQKAEALINTRPEIPLEEDGGRTVTFSFSGGYVYGHCRENDDLRRMFKQGDEQLYRSKAAGKNRLSGAEYQPWKSRDEVLNGF